MPLRNDSRSIAGSCKRRTPDACNHLEVKIAIDIRRIRDFGIGTYIRNLLNALAVEDGSIQYLLLAQKSDAPLIAHLPSSFQPVFYDRQDTDRLEHLFLPLFLRRLKPDLIHFPTNRVPLL